MDITGGLMANIKTANSTIYALAAILLGAGALYGQSVPGMSLPSSSSTSSSALSSAMAPSALTPLPQGFENYRITPGSLLQLHVYGAAEMDGPLRVSADGMLQPPLLQPIKVTGLTIADAQTQMAKAFKAEQVLVNPQVSLTVIEYAFEGVQVSGEVRRPGRLELLQPDTLANVLSNAGGMTDYAGGVITVTRVVNGQTQTLSVPIQRKSNESLAAFIVQANDEISVPRAGIVYVLGAVTRPGGYVMEEDGHLNAAEALSMANGTTMIANTGGIRIVRDAKSSHPQEIPVHFYAMTTGRESPPDLMPNDILYVPVSKAKTFVTVGAGLLGSAAIATVYAVR
jgi:polysaccharide export outer membrane protein